MRKLFLLASLFIAPVVSAQELVEFENGQMADANDINKNFQGLKNAIEKIEVAPTVQPRDKPCTQSDLVGQWYQTKGVSGGFEISVSNFFSSGDYVLEGLQVTALGEEEYTVFGTYEFRSSICGFTLEIINLPSLAVGVINLDKSVMKLTAADGRGEYGDFTLILVSEEPDDTLLNKGDDTLLNKRAVTGSEKAKSFGPEDFVPIDISLEHSDSEKLTQ